MRFRRTSTAGMSNEDAEIINMQKEEIRNGYSVPELRLRDHHFTVPLDYSVPQSPKITVFAREAVAVSFKGELTTAFERRVNNLSSWNAHMRLKTDIKPKEATFEVVLDALALTPFYRAFLITADFFPKIPGQKFEDLLLEHVILSFIRDLGHTGDITYLTVVNVDYLHQPWRAFATVINKCLSGKETGMDKIHFLFHIENKDAKKTNKMSYPRFTKIIIDYFISKDRSISRRNKMFWHTARDDTMFTSMRCISKIKILKYMKIKAKGLAVLSKVALTEAKQLKLATKRSKKYFHISYASGLGDGVDTQLKVPDEKQQKTSGTDEGTGTIPGVPDVPTYESESKKEYWRDSDEEDDYEDDFDDDSDDNDESDDERTESIRDEILDPNKTNAEHNEKEEEYDDRFNIEEEENIADEESMDEEEDDEVTKELELYDDVNVNLGNEDTDMTNVDQGASEQQNVSQELGFGNKLLNLDNPSPADNEIASLMDTTAQHETTIPKITSSFTTTVPPPPPFFNPLQQEATPTPTPTTSETTTSLPALPDFASVFKFNERVSNLEKDVSEIKQVDQYAQALSSIPAIVDRYMDNKLEEAINKAILAHNLDCRQEAQDEKNAYIELVDTSMRALIKEEVNTQFPQILPQVVSDFANIVIEKNVTESVEVAVLTRSSSQPTSTYEAAASLRV
ncbi:hypothetical protein Tco_1142400 [Tanacetum coccineum]